MYWSQWKDLAGNECLLVLCTLLYIQDGGFLEKASDYEAIRYNRELYLRSNA